MSLPDSRKELRKRWETGERFTFLLFYGHRPPDTGVNASCLSQWFERDFEVDQTIYSTAEHWMMAEKARLFEDDEMLERILDSDTPKEAKAFGRKVRNFDPNTWDRHKFEIVVRGNAAKFNQHKDLKAYLLATADYQPDQPNEITQKFADQVAEKPRVYRVGQDDKTKSHVILVEAAGRDMIWGIGLGKNNPKALDPFTWRGKNLLGFALTKVREDFITRH